jgi:hypothetical protein
MGGRDQSERLVAINRNRWSQSAGAPRNIIGAFALSLGLQALEQSIALLEICAWHLRCIACDCEACAARSLPKFGTFVVILCVGVRVLIDVPKGAFGPIFYEKLAPIEREAERRRGVASVTPARPTDR